MPRRYARPMPLATMRQVLDEAAKGGYGVGAFNVNNMEQLQGIVGGRRGDAAARDRPGLARRDLLRRRRTTCAT